MAIVVVSLDVLITTLTQVCCSKEKTEDRSAVSYYMLVSQRKARIQRKTSGDGDFKKQLGLSV